MKFAAAFKPERWLDFSDRLFFGKTEPRRLAALRIAFGILALLFLVELYPEREIWFSDFGLLQSPNAVTWQRIFGGWLPFSGLYDPALAGAILLGGAWAAVGMILGIWTRITVPVTAFVVWAIQGRTYYVLHGGDQLVRVILVFLAFSDCGRVWSLDSRFAARNQSDPVPAWPLRLIQLTVFNMYFASVLFKLRCPTWLDGTAVGFSLQLREQARWVAPAWIAQKPWVLLMTYGTLFTELGLALMVPFRKLRWIFIPLGISLHLGIEYSLNIPHFSLAAMATYFAFWNPKSVQMRHKLSSNLGI